MRRKELEERYRARGADQEAVARAVAAVEAFEEFASTRGRDVDSVSVDLVQSYLDRLIRNGTNDQEGVLALARYAYLTEQWDVVIYLRSVFGPQGVVASMAERTALLAGEETRSRIFDDLQEPSFGSPPELYPAVARELMEGLQRELPPAIRKKVLAGNHHGIPPESFAEERKRFLELGDIPAYLKDLHERSVAELEQHARDGRVWYEQRITSPVVEFVRKNQEVLSGVLEGDRIFATKIPYDPDRFLAETDPLTKRYYSCHCPFARSVILENEPAVPAEWCYCSAGFAKLRFDAAFDREHEVEVLESVLAGSDRCRFAIILPAPSG